MDKLFPRKVKMKNLKKLKYEGYGIYGIYNLKSVALDRCNFLKKNFKNKVAYGKINIKQLGEISNNYKNDKYFNFRVNNKNIKRKTGYIVMVKRWKMFNSTEFIGIVNAQNLTQLELFHQVVKTSLPLFYLILGLLFLIFIVIGLIKVNKKVFLITRPNYIIIMALSLGMVALIILLIMYYPEFPLTVYNLIN